MIKRYLPLTTVLFLALLMHCPLRGEPLSLTVQAESALLINADNGRILFEKNSTEPHYPASITKVATSLWSLKLKRNGLDEKVTASGDSVVSITEEAKRRSNYTVPSWWLVPGATHAGIKKGEVLSLKDLHYALLTVSAGDAANVIAEYSAGDIPTFMKGMNQYIKSIGCTQTHFENPNGLFHPEQKTTARDMALIMIEALKEPFFCEVIAAKSYTRPKTNKQASCTLVQSNRLLRPGPYYYPKVIGGKTGYLSSAQNTFVVAAKEKDRTLIAVFLKTKERTDLWKDAIKLFDAAFNQPKIERVVLSKGPTTMSVVEDNFDTPLLTYLAHDVKLAYYPAEEPQVKGLIYWDTFSPPIAKGERVGEFRLVDEKGDSLTTAPLYAANDVAGSLSHRLQHFFTSGSLPAKIFKALAVLFALFGVGFMLLRLTRKGR